MIAAKNAFPSKTVRSVSCPQNKYSPSEAHRDVCVGGGGGGRRGGGHKTDREKWIGGKHS